MTRSCGSPVSRAWLVATIALVVLAGVASAAPAGDGTPAPGPITASNATAPTTLDPGSGGAPLESVGPSPDEEEGTNRRRTLAEEFSDPLTSLPQIFVQDAYTPSSFGTEAAANRVIVRAIVPRIPRFSLLPFVQLIRPSIQLVSVPTGRGRGTTTAFGDFQIFDLLALPWPGRSSGLYMGVGPVMIFPTATDDRAGQGAWQVGPAFGAIYKGLPGFIFGALVQNPISFAYTAGDRPAVSTLIVQPIALAYLGKGFYVKSGDAAWTMGWRAGTATVLPISLGLGWVHVREGGLPPINLFVSGEWTAYRDRAPVAPQTTVRFGLTVAFPEYRPW